MDDFRLRLQRVVAYFKEGSSERTLLWLLVGCLVSFWLWAALSQIEQQVSGQGSIIPSGQAKIVQHLEGGIVNEILVHENEQVEADQPLFRISNQQAESDAKELQLQVASTRLQIRRLEAERDGKNAPDFSDLVEGSKLGAVDNEMDLFKAHQRNYAESLSILQTQAHQKELKLIDLQTELENLRSEAKVAQDQFAINDRLWRAGAISETRYLQSKSSVQSFQTKMGSVEKSIPITRSELGEVKSRINEMQQKRQADILDDLRKAQLTLGQMNERIKTPDDKVRRTVVTSPIRGVINKLFISTLGGVVRPGDRLVEIVPLDEKLIVEARISTKDRGLIWTGLPALVKITAYDYEIYGGIKGTVKDISPDTLLDEHSRPYYRVRIQLEKNKLGDKMPLFPGMTAEVNILSGKITILQSLLRPVWEVKEKALREAR